MKFKVTQIFRDGHDNLDDDVKIIDANNKEEAEKIYWEKNFRIKGFYKLTVEPMEENNEFKRMQELAGINETTKNESMIEGITNIIKKYSVGNEWIEIDTKDLSSMIEEIILYCKDEFSP